MQFFDKINNFNEIMNSMMTVAYNVDVQFYPIICNKTKHSERRSMLIFKLLKPMNICITHAGHQKSNTF